MSRKIKHTEAVIGETTFLEEQYSCIKFEAVLRGKAGKQLSDPAANPEIVVRAHDGWKTYFTLKVDIENNKVIRYQGKPMGFLCESKILAWVKKCLYDFSQGKGGEPAQ